MSLHGPLGWLLVAVGLTGTVLNIRKRRVCFALWMVSNSALCVLHAAEASWPLALQFAVYAGLAVWGWLAWRVEP
jgi:nicotinamide riboside transporter PnuC